jgi:hypothetical protein
MVDRLDAEPKWRKIGKWIGIRGHWHVDGGSIRYTGPESESATWPHGICVSDAKFSDGELKIKIMPGSRLDGRVLLGYRNPDEPYILVGLGGGHAYTLGVFEPNQGWRNVIGVGPQADLVPDREYHIHISVRGQKINLIVDGVSIFDYLLPSPIQFGQAGLFAWGDKRLDDTSFHDGEYKLLRGRGEAFVVMQFSGFEEIYSEVIKPVAESFDLHPYRADEVYGPTSILDDIVKGIETAQVVIAEITPSNENVFYEVGYSHALKKPTIILADKSKKLPFDLSGIRCILYENSIAGKRKVERNLRQHLQAIFDH